MNHSIIEAAHRPYAAVYADASARTSATGFPRGEGGAVVAFAVEDLYKKVLQLDNATEWVLADDSPVTWTQVPGGLANDSVSNAMLRNSAALSVIGRSANSTGDPADIAAANDGEVLRRSGTSLGFGTVATAGLADDAVTYAKMQDVSAASKLLGRGDGGAGIVQEITLGANLTMSGSTLSATAPGSGAGSGDVVGPSSSTNNNVALFDGVTGKLLKDSGKALIAADIVNTPAGNIAATNVQSALNELDSEKLTQAQADALYEPLGGGGGSWTIVKKTADETKTSNATVADDAALTFSMLANTKYHVRLFVIFDTHTTPDFKWRHAGPASPTLVRVMRKWTPGGSAALGTQVDTAYSASDQSIAGNTGSGHIQLDCIIHNGANAGTFSFQWAQNVSDANPTTVYAGSYLEYTTF